MSLISSPIPSLTRQPALRRGATAPATPTEPTVKPLYEVHETDEAYGLVVQLPGVTKDGLDLTAEEGVFTLRARRAWAQPKDWTLLYRESTDAPYELTLQHDNAIDVDKIHAELRDGVLRVSLPKSEAVKPRKISVS